MIEHLKNLIVGLIMITAGAGALMAITFIVVFIGTNDAAGWGAGVGLMLVVAYYSGKYWREI